MENVHSTPEFGAPQVSYTQNAEKKRVYEPDGKDVLVLFLPFRNCVPVENEPINIHCRQ